MRYIPVIGLEIHAELMTETKLFCGCPNTFGADENTMICPYCSATPGTLPLLNKNAVSLAVKAGLALDCKINNCSAFDRKNYFYPDLPKGYQITQFERPICTDGFIEINEKKFRINNIHIEEDAGKLIHDNEKGTSSADYNRAGVPLIEIVTEPDFSTVEEVRSFVEQIALRLKYTGVCDSKMEQGSLRVDVNISVMPENSKILGTRAEIKNLNSIRSITRAIEYEIKRQSEIINKGKSVIRETRRFDENTGTTFSMRTKESLDDYRYFPEPDIPPIYISDDEINELKCTIPELPHRRFLRYTKGFGLSESDAELLIHSKEFSDFYDNAIAEYNSYKTISTLMLGELQRCVNDTGINVGNSKITPSQLAMTAKMADENKISKNAAKSIVSLLFNQGGSAEEIAQNNGFLMNCDTVLLESAVNNIIAQNSELAKDYKNGNKKLFGFFMGQLIRELGKSANPQLAKETLAKKLNE